MVSRAEVGITRQLPSRGVSALPRRARESGDIQLRHSVHGVVVYMEAESWKIEETKVESYD